MSELDKKKYEGLKILVIDDQMQDVVVMKALLESTGCQVDVGFDGEVAIELLSQNQYDLLVIDWNMPGLDAGETLQFAEKYFEESRQSQLKNIQSLPYVVYSGSSKDRLDIPETNYFRYIDLWEKSHGLIELTKKVTKYVA